MCEDKVRKDKKSNVKGTLTKRAELQKKNTFNKAANKSWIMRRTVKMQSARMTETRQRETAEGRGRVKNNEQKCEREMYKCNV